MCNILQIIVLYNLIFSEKMSCTCYSLIGIYTNQGDLVDICNFTLIKLKLYLPSLLSFCLHIFKGMIGIWSQLSAGGLEKALSWDSSLAICGLLYSSVMRWHFGMAPV